MASTAEFERLLADARSNLPGAVIDSISAEMFAAIREFTDFTNAWYEEINVPIVAGTTSYTITPATTNEGRINRLLNLYDSADLDKRPCAAVRMDLPGVIVLQQQPSTAATWVAKVGKVICDQVDGSGVLIPATSPLVPTWLVQKYWNAFLWGTLARMHMQGGKPYSNPQMGAFRAAQFNSEKTKARVDALVGNVRGNPTWSFPGFASGSQRRVG